MPTPVTNNSVACFCPICIGRPDPKKIVDSDQFSKKVDAITVYNFATGCQKTYRSVYAFLKDYGIPQDELEKLHKAYQNGQHLMKVRGMVRIPIAWHDDFKWFMKLDTKKKRSLKYLPCVNETAFGQGLRMRFTMKKVNKKNKKEKRK